MTDTKDACREAFIDWREELCESNPDMPHSYDDWERECFNAGFQAAYNLPRGEMESGISIVNEKTVRKSIATELTRCADSAESHDWNNQIHRQYMVNAVILAIRPYMHKTNQEPKRQATHEDVEKCAMAMWKVDLIASLYYREKYGESNYALMVKAVLLSMGFTLPEGD